MMKKETNEYKEGTDRRVMNLDGVRSIASFEGVLGSMQPLSREGGGESTSTVAPVVPSSGPLVMLLTPAAGPPVVVPCVLIVALWVFVVAVGLMVMGVVVGGGRALAQPATGLGHSVSHGDLVLMVMGVMVRVGVVGVGVAVGIARPRVIKDHFQRVIRVTRQGDRADMVAGNHVSSRPRGVPGPGAAAALTADVDSVAQVPTACALADVVAAVAGATAVDSSCWRTLSALGAVVALVHAVPGGHCLIFKGFFCGSSTGCKVSAGFVR